MLSKSADLICHTSAVKIYEGSHFYDRGLAPRNPDSPPTPVATQFLNAPAGEQTDMPMTRILERLYLGSAKDADHLAKANPEGISAVINVSTERSERKGPDLAYLHYPVRDGATLEPAVFEEVMDAIAREIRRGKVLVHCTAGMSRSPVMVAVYLRYTGHQCFECALETIAELRPFIDPNPVLVLSAKRYPRLRRRDDDYAMN
jgi:atypical dual specificity phosphatase